MLEKFSRRGDRIKSLPLAYRGRRAATVRILSRTLLKVTLPHFPSDAVESPDAQMKQVFPWAD